MVPFFTLPVPAHLAPRNEVPSFRAHVCPYEYGQVRDEASGSTNQTAAITAGGLLLEGGANFTLNNAANSFATLAADTTQSFSVVDDQSLTVGTAGGIRGVVSGGGMSLTTTSGDISITQQLKALDHPLTLTSAGTISESAAGAIDTTLLTGLSVGAVGLTSVTNAITDLGSFSTGGNNNIVIDDNVA